MVKNRHGLTGIARLVAQTFQPAATPVHAEAAQPVTAGLNYGSPEADIDERPAKRQKTSPTDALEPFKAGKTDVHALVPYYKHISEVPEHLKKYFAQRKRYFSLYDEGCLLDEEGWYSVTPERVADNIAERCRCDVILDAFCGVGGNAIAFAKTCERVIAMDVNPTRLALARHNAEVYGVQDRIEFVLGDYLSFARNFSSIPGSAHKIDVVFLSPPWGGPSYLSGTDANALASLAKSQGGIGPAPVEAHPEYSLSSIQPIHGAELFHLTLKITHNVAYYLPRNTKMEEISELLHPAPSKDILTAQRDPSTPDGEKSEVVEVEEAWMGTKLKALTCYFGGLAAGQEQLF